MNQADQPDHRERDRVNLHGFLSDVWAMRKMILLAVLVVTVGYWGFFASKLFFSPPTFTHRLTVEFTFEGTNKGLYPNKSPFSISDLIAPKLLAEIYTLNGLTKKEMSRPKFMHSFRIVPHAPNYELIKKKYDALFEKQNLRIEELRKLQNDMRDELDQLKTRAAVVSFQSKWRAISKEKIRNIMLSVPKHWADKMINEYGVLELDINLYSKVLFDEYEYKTLDYMVAIDKVETNILLVSYSISELLAFPNSKRVNDKKTGYNLLDLQKLVNDIRTYDLRRLSSFIQELGISTHKDAVKLYYNHQINKLQREKAYQSEQAELINQTLNDYIQRMGSENKTSVVRENTIDMVQASGDFLDRITELVKQSEDLGYRQNLHDQHIKYKTEEARIEYEIAQKQALIGALEKKSDEGVFGKDYEERLMQENFPIILSKMREYLDIFNRLHNVLSKENFGYDTRLYKINAGAVKTSGSIMSVWNKGIFGLLVFGTTLATIAGKMIFLFFRKSD